MALKVTNYSLEDFLKTSRNKSYFVAAVTVVFTVILLIFGILPAYSSVASQNRQNGERDAAIVQLESKLDTLKELSVQEQSKTDTINEFNKVFPNGLAQETVIERINEVAVENEVFVQSISFSDAEREISLSTVFKISKQVNSQIVGIFIEGSHSNTLAFIEDLESSTLIFNVRGLTLIRKLESELAESSPNREYRLSLQAEFYFQDLTTNL